jgi:hypothetical protein
MKIIKVEKHGVDELIANMHEVGLLTRPEIKVYRDANIRLETMHHTNYISPAQCYVLICEIMKVRDLRWALQEHGIDLFKLDGYVTIQVENHVFPIDVLPPVVEESREADGSIVSILNDGMHRVYLTRMERSPIQVVSVRNIPKEYPYYAFPLANGWNDVEIVRDLPEGCIKKWHRIKDYKSLYRNFNIGFNSVGSPRGNFTEK